MYMSFMRDETHLITLFKGAKQKILQRKVATFSLSYVKLKDYFWKWFYKVCA